MGGFAWVTLATNDSYSLGALVLAHSLKNSGTKQDLVVLVTPGVTNSMREKLSSVFNVVKEVNILDSKDETNLKLLKRPELGVTFTKLHCWRLTQYDKCVFLDADTMVLQNCDELFDREELSAAHDVGWPDCFNSGVFVYRPSLETYENLIKFALEKGSFDGGDQGLLNMYFSDWSTKDISKHLPFIYNMSSTACYSYLPAFKQFGSNAKILHFIAETKPWLQYFNTETRQVQPSSETRHLKNILQKWWDIFCQLIHPNLTSDMARSSSDVRQTNQNQVSSYNSPEIIHTAHNINSPIPRSNTPKTDIWDPWENYIQEPTFAVPDPQLNEPNLKPIESHNTNACYFASHNIPVSPEQNYEIPHTPFSFDENTNNSIPIESHHPVCNIEVEPQPHPQPNLSSPELRTPSPPPATLPEPLVVVDSVPILNAPTHPVLSTECEAPSIVCTETTLHSPEDNIDDENGGLAGAFAQLTLGSPRTAEQSALDDHLRRQGWEVGNIDYLGRDSFDNIWSKICETLSTVPQEPAEESSTPVETSTTAATETTTSVEAPAPQPQETKSETPVAPTPTPPLPPTKPEEAPAPKLPETPASAPPPETATPAAEPQKPEAALPETPQCPLKPKEPEAPAVPEPVQCPLKPKEPEAVAPEAPLKSKEPEAVAPETPQSPLAPKEPEAVAPETPQCPLKPKEPEAVTPEAAQCPLKPKEAEVAAPEPPQCPLKPKEPEAAVPETPQCPLKPKEPEAAAPEAPQSPLKPKEPEAAVPETPQSPLKPKEPEAAAPETPQCPLKPKEPEAAAPETPQCPLKPKEPEAIAQETPQCPLKPKEPEAAAPETPQCPLKPKEPEAIAQETPQCPLKPKEAAIATPETPQCPLKPKEAEITTPETPPKPKEPEAAPVQETPKKCEEQQPLPSAPAPAEAAPPTPEVPATPEVTPATPEVVAAGTPAPPPIAPAVEPAPATPSPQPGAAAATPESPKPKKEEEQPKQTPETTATPQPTPPPRKGSGGGKKGGKSKK